MRDYLAAHLEERAEQLTKKKKAKEEKMIKKLDSLEKRHGQIVKVHGTGHVERREINDKYIEVFYQVHLKYLIKQCDHFYMEEEIEKRKALFNKNKMIDDMEVFADFSKQDAEEELVLNEGDRNQRVPFVYDRLKAVRYAERWWNDYNPSYIKFDVDCTNYVSQCLHAGEAPMRGYPNRSAGWWHQNKNWSFSWSVANALKVYLHHSKAGLRAREVGDPQELQLGDVICYDFQGDGRFDHNTIVTGKDANGMPLVNAHTYNSRMRYWAYEDSTAYTPNIKYKFYTIIDDS